MRDSRQLCGLFKQGNYLVGDRAVGATRDAAVDGALDLIGGVAAPHTKPFGKPAAAGVSFPGLASPSSDRAGAAAIPTAEKTSSFAKMTA
jgi:hypothetical protein